MNTKYIFGIVTILPIVSIADCYVLHDASGKVLYASHSPPFDISTPPESPASVASKKAGQKLQIYPGVCTKNHKENLQESRYNEITGKTVETMDSARIMAYKMLEQEQKQTELQYQAQQIQTELNRYHRGILGDVKRHNDLHERLYPQDR